MSDIPKLVSTWMLMETLHSLYETGVLAFLERTSSFHAPLVLAEKCGLKQMEMEAALRYVSILLPGVIIRNELNEYGVGTEYSSSQFQNSLYFSLAYAPVVNQLKLILTAEKEFGTDIHKNARELSISSDLFIRNTNAIVAERMREREKEVDVCVDLGCGSGHLLVDISRALRSQAVGIDSTADAFLGHEVSSSDDGIRFIEGKIERPEEWAHLLPGGKKIFTASMVLHELLYEPERIEKFFASFKIHFPGCALYLIEYAGMTMDELARLPEDYRHLNAAYYYMHPLTKQGYPLSDQRWRLLFDRCGLEDAERLEGFRDCIVYRIVF